MEATSSQLTRWRRLLLVRDSRPIFDRDDSPRACICALCGPDIFYRTFQVQAHHIRPKALYPVLALDLSNGVMLCAGHHQGVVHNHNASVDIRDRSHDSGWLNWLVHFRRWNDLSANEQFNFENQGKIF